MPFRLCGLNLPKAIYAAPLGLRIVTMPSKIISLRVSENAESACATIVCAHAGKLERGRKLIKRLTSIRLLVVAAVP